MPVPEAREELCWAGKDIEKATTSQKMDLRVAVNDTQREKPPIMNHLWLVALAAELLTPHSPAPDPRVAFSCITIPESEPISLPIMHGPIKLAINR